MIPPPSARSKARPASLRSVNEELWDTEDNIRRCEADGNFGGEFVQLARTVYQANDRRAAIKRKINQRFGSALVEEKSYPDWQPRQDGTEAD